MSDRVSVARGRAGFSLVELLILTLLIAILLPALGAARRTSRQMQNNTQLRGIHQSLVIFAQANKIGGQDGYYPGLGPKGQLVAEAPSARLDLLLEGNYFTPEYVINPADAAMVVAAPGAKLTAGNYSYAMLAIADEAADAGRRAEWKETLNTNALVLGDRNTGPAGELDQVSSVWNQPGDGDWRGGVVRNDNSTAFETQPTFHHTVYGDAPANDQDHLFDRETDAGHDADLIHQAAAAPGLALR